MDNDTARVELLLRLYDQLYNDIDRHIMVVWHSVTALVGAFAVFALAEKEIITIDVATSLLILLAGWLLAHLLDASYWYNRNLLMIANIDKQFLKKEDLREIHYYFGAPRPRNRMIVHLKIQFALGLGIGGIMLVYHFASRVLPGFDAPIHNFQFQRAMPYLLVVLILSYLGWLWKNRRDSYQEFIKNSPGKTIDTTGIEYGVGHGFTRAESKPAEQTPTSNQNR